MAQKTVLLAEDDVEIRDILQDLLEAEGYDVVPASHGRQALEFLEGVRGGKLPDLVVLDLMMPLVDGVQVLETMKSDPVLSSIPVVVLSRGGARTCRPAPPRSCASRSRCRSCSTRSAASSRPACRAWRPRPKRSRSPRIARRPGRRASARRTPGPRVREPGSRPAPAGAHPRRASRASPRPAGGCRRSRPRRRARPLRSAGERTELANGARARHLAEAIVGERRARSRPRRRSARRTRAGETAPSASDRSWCSARAAFSASSS